MAENKPSGIHAAMVAVMAECGAIAKTKKARDYAYRGIDDVYNELQEVKSKHGVFELPEVIDIRTEERQSKSGSILIYRILTIRYTFYALDGSSVSAVTIGEAMDTSDKACNKAMSVAHKYALIQAFNIRTSDLDDGEKNTHQAGSQAQPPGNGQPARQTASQEKSDLVQTFNKAKAALSVFGVTQNDMLTYINKKSVWDITREDLVQLSNWLQQKKGSQK